MDPLTLSLLLGAGVKAGGEVMEARGERKKTDFDARMAQQIADLQRREELSALGLSADEMQAMRGEMQRATAATRRAGQARSGLALAGAGAGSGEQLSRSIAEEAALQQQQQQIAESLATADLQRAAEEEDELTRLIFQQSQREMDRRAASADAVKDIGDIGLETAGMIGKLSGGGGADFSEEDIAAAADKFGVDKAKAKEYLGFIEDNPEFFEAL